MLYKWKQKQLSSTFLIIFVSYSLREGECFFFYSPFLIIYCFFIHIFLTVFVDALNDICLFQAAYDGNTLGLPKLCPPENILLIDQHVLYSYLKNHFTPSRMVVAGVGVEHDALVEACQK